MMLRQTLTAATALLLVTSCASSPPRPPIAELSDEQLLAQLREPYVKPQNCRTDDVCYRLQEVPPRGAANTYEQQEKRNRELQQCWDFSCSTARQKFDAEQRTLQDEAKRRGLIP